MNLKEDIARLKSHLAQLSTERNFRQYSELLRTASYIKNRFLEFGFECVEAQDYEVDGEIFTNLTVRLGKSPALVVGAHYDSYLGSPGANDNGSGVALLLTLAERIASLKEKPSVEFVAFVNEEPPFFRSAQMGSYVYASKLKSEGREINAMICIDTVGFYSDAENSQIETFGQLPSKADFIAFVGPTESKSLVEQSASFFRQSKVELPVVCVTKALSENPFVNYSDHWPFSEFGWPAFMVTDTGPLRSKYYHTAEDSVDKLDLEKMARLANGLVAVVTELGSRD